MRELPGEAAGAESGVALSEAERGTENGDVSRDGKAIPLIVGGDGKGLVASHYETLYGVSEDDLLEELRCLVAQTVDNLARMAAIVQRLSESDGIARAVEAFGQKIVDALLDIANGSLHPEVYLRFGHRTDLLNRVRSLPESEQRKIVEAETLPLVRVRGPNRCVQRVRPELIGSSQARQLIGDNGVRSVEEQIQYLTPEQIESPKVKVDYSRLGITVNGAFVGVDDLEDYVGKLRGVKYQFKGLPQFKDDPEFAGKTESEIAEILAPDIPNIVGYFIQKKHLLGGDIDFFMPAAMSAMLRAIRGFNPSHGAKFRSTYLTTAILRSCWRHVKDEEEDWVSEADGVVAEFIEDNPVQCDHGLSDADAAFVWKSLGGLPDREAEVIRMRFQDGKTFKEIGQVLGMSGEWVRQIESKALEQLRQNDSLSELAGV